MTTTKKTKKRTPKRARRRSTDHTASIGAKLLAQYKAMGASGLEKDWYVKAFDKVKWADVAALAGSVVAQDEHKGRSGK